MPKTSKSKAARGRWPYRLAVGAALLILLSTVVTVFATGGGRVLLDAAFREPRAVITSPTGPKVSHTEQLGGTVMGLDEGESVWAVTEDMTTTRLFPQDHPCSVDDGTFACGTYYIGNDSGHGEDVTILIVRADAAAAAAFAQYQVDKGGPSSTYNPGMSQMPAGAHVVGRGRFVRAS